MLNTSCKTVFFISLVSMICLNAVSQKKDLTQDQMLKGKLPAITIPLPVISWDKDDRLVISKRMHPDSAAMFYSEDPKTGKELFLHDYKRPDQPKTKSAFLKDNDVFFSDEKGTELRLTNNKDKEVNPTLSPDNSAVAYTRNNNLFVYDINNKKETQLTSDGNDSIMNGYASWVYTEEILGRASTYRTFWWSPNSKQIAFFRTDDSPVPVHIITDGAGQHGVEERERYPKVGDKNPEVKIGIVHLNDNHISWADFNAKDDQYFGMPYWTPDGSALWVQWMNRLQNDLKVYSVDPGTGSKKEVYDEKQKTWVQLEDGFERLHFLKNNRNFILESDKTGWNQLYLYDMTGHLINPVTEGKFTITNVNWIDENSETIYFTARGHENSARLDFYSVRFNGKDFKRLTFGDYYNIVQMSPSGAYFITTYGNS
nr:DPP IV N-terminal domain-containing protein [Chitinophagaceae bacterium]